MWLDLRYALRMMTKSVGLTAVLAVTLALGIGASTTIFSVVNSVVLKPLPYENPDQLVRVYTEFQGMDLRKFWMSPPEFDDLQKSCRSCESVGAWANGTARAQSATAMAQAAFAIMNGQPVPNDPIHGLPYLWDPATRTLSPPDSPVFQELQLKPLVVPTL